MHRNLTYEDLLLRVYEIVCVDFNSCVYEMKSFLNTIDKIVRFKIKNDEDVQFVLGEAVAVLKVYVIVQTSQQP